MIVTNLFINLPSALLYRAKYLWWVSITVTATSWGIVRNSSSKLQTTATGYSTINVTSSNKSSEIFVVAPSLSASVFVISRILAFLSSWSTITWDSLNLSMYSSGLWISIFCFENLCPCVKFEDSLSMILIFTTSQSRIESTQRIGRENLTSFVPHLIKCGPWSFENITGTFSCNKSFVFLPLIEIFA